MYRRRILFLEDPKSKEYSIYKNERIDEMSNGIVTLKIKNEYAHLVHSSYGFGFMAKHKDIE